MAPVASTTILRRNQKHRQLHNGNNSTIEYFVKEQYDAENEYTHTFEIF